MTARCPICKKSVERAYAPFCSKRCADVDLQRWFTGGYAIAGSSQDLSEDGESTARDLEDDD
jgi:endogenous inhibitor of DNA gyrase (YacG/DUF329 family)